MPAAKPKTTTTRESHRAADDMQEAISAIDRARHSLQGEARAQLERTADRLREIAGDMRSRAGDELHDLESSLDRAEEAMRIEFGVRAIRAQTSLEALTTLSGELRRRRAELTS